MLAQIIGLTLAGVGFFFKMPVPLVLGGYVCLLTDIYSFITKRTKPSFAILFYILGAVITGRWLGILYGSILFNVFDIGINTMVYFAMLSKKKK